MPFRKQKKVEKEIEKPKKIIPKKGFGSKKKKTEEKPKTKKFTRGFG